MFKPILKETFSKVYKNKLDEKWRKPKREKLPFIEVKGRKYHYEACEESSPFSYVIHGRNGARYGLIGENGVLIALNSKTKKVVEKIGKFKVTESGLQWMDPNKNEKMTEGKEGKNVHLEHLEDRVIDLGSRGAEQSLDFLNKIGSNLSGSAEKPYNITVKWDGCVHPETILKTTEGDMSINEIINSSKEINVITFNLETLEDEENLAYKPRVNNNNKNWIEVILENGESVITTEDHEFYTTNRGWVPAKLLNENDDIKTL